MENAESCFGFTFSGCPVGKISGLCERVGQVMSELGSGSRELEMGRMKTIVKNQMLQILNQVRGVARARKGCGMGMAGGAWN